MSAAPPNSSTEPRFSDLLERAMRVWDQRKADDGVFGLAVPLGP